MVFVPTADVGEGTRDAARAEGSCGRWHSRCGARRPERSEAAPGMLPAPSSAWPASTGAMLDSHMSGISSLANVRGLSHACAVDENHRRMILIESGRFHNEKTIGLPTDRLRRD